MVESNQKSDMKGGIKQMKMLENETENHINFETENHINFSKIAPAIS